MSNEKMNVLVVDDRPENLLVVESVLEGLDLHIFKVTSGNDALALMLDHEFGLVILDIQMPEMNGFEVADLMKGMEKTRHIPIIFLTAIYKEEASVFKGYEVGAVDYLFKPIQPIILRSKVNVFINLYKQKEELRRQALMLEDRLQELLQLQMVKSQLENLSQIDGLTGISNRRALDQFLKRHWELAQNGSLSISFLMIDIDNFKAYNDNYGHCQGDQCLIRVAQVLSQTIEHEQDCLVGRYGGEEFSVVLPNRNQQEATMVAQHIHENLQHLALVHEYSSLGNIVTVSIGTISIVPTEGVTIKEFIDCADKALYEAKRQGRNRVVSWENVLRNNYYI
jgi:diguanylate cyclase (GGDEF)-like protein